MRGTSRCLHAARAKRWLLVRSCPPAPRANGAPCTPTRRLPACKPCPCTPACTAWWAHLHALVHRTALVQGPFARSRSSHALPTSPAVCTRTPTCVAHSPPPVPPALHTRGANPAPPPSPLADGVVFVCITPPPHSHAALPLAGAAPPAFARAPFSRPRPLARPLHTHLPPRAPLLGRCVGGEGGKATSGGPLVPYGAPLPPPPPHCAPHLHAHLHTQLYMHAPLHDPVVSARPTEPHSAP